MQYQCYWASWDLPARIRRCVNYWQHLKAIVLGLLLSPLIGPGQVFGQAKTIELSPILAKSAVLGPVDQNQQISVILALPLGDARGAADFVQHVSTPQDPLFRKYLSPQEFAARFGANASDFAALKEWATANQLTIAREGSARTILQVRGTVAQFQALFHTELANFRSPAGDEFYSARTAPIIPEAIAAKVSGVIGLTDSIRYAPRAKIAKVIGENEQPSTGPDAAGGTGPGGGFSAQDLRTAYQIPGYGGVVPQTVAVFEQGGFHQADVAKYLTKMQLPNVNVRFVGVNGYNGQVNDKGVELEAVLDIDMVIGINPDVHQVLVYEDGTDTFPVALLAALDAVSTDNLAQTLSISYGVDEAQQTSTQMEAENAALTAIAAQGITVFVSAGDDGAYGLTGGHYYPAKLEAPDPGSQPLVTCVGGTSLHTSPAQAYLGETVWNDLGLYDGATGGGVSSYWSLPSYQPASYVTFNGGSSTFRNVPDVAAVGDPLTGVAVYSKINGGWLQMGGTSVAAPIWGGLSSIMNAGLAYLVDAKIGFLNPLLYNIAVSSGDQYQFNVTDGSNGNVNLYGTPGFTAGFQYNNCAGLGSIYGSGFAQVVLSSETGGIPPSGFIFTKIDVTDTTAIATWTPASQATGYAVALFHLGPAFNTSQGYVSKRAKMTFTGLTPKTAYTLVVYAVNPNGATLRYIGFTTK
jgi:subtilase family serine protease